jgi:hypothetical protein
MKRFVLLASFVALSALPVFAGPDAGCGAGSMLITGNGKIRNLFAITTNHSFGSQTFGITSGTSGCTSSSIVKTEVEQRIFVAANLANLSQEMAQGQGQYVSALAGLMGCPAAAQGEFAKLSQERYGALFPAADAHPDAVLASLKVELARHPALAASCTRLA